MIEYDFDKINEVKKLLLKKQTNLEKIRKEKRINKKRTFKRIWNKCKNY